jgi:glucose/arabinose dehydrogenase
MCRGLQMISFRIIVVAFCLLIAKQVDAADPVKLELPPGFTATVFATGLGSARHIAVRENGDVYVTIRRAKDDKGVIGLRDSDGDGVADRQVAFGHAGGSGAAIYKDYLFFSSENTVYRMKFSEDALLPEGPIETVASGFPKQRVHAAKSLAISAAGDLFVNSGAPSNACQESGRTPGSTGQDPCPQLQRGGGIWKFSADRLNQDQMAEGQRYVTGIRNSVALAFDDELGELYFVMHGRDQLDVLWPRFFDAEQRQDLPAEEFHVAPKGTDFGWPYTYFDGLKNQRMVGPEYGGDGEQTAPAGKYPNPLTAFPAHWAPNGLIFYHAAQFPAEYSGGAFVAFHGSWNREPGPQGGYNVVFVPMKNGKPNGDWRIFADGFMGDKPVRTRSQAKHRPVGLAIGPDGSLYVSDSSGGTIWKISYSTTD